LGRKPSSFSFLFHPFFFQPSPFPGPPLGRRNAIFAISTPSPEGKRIKSTIKEPPPSSPSQVLFLLGLPNFFLSDYVLPLVTGPVFATLKGREFFKDITDLVHIVDGLLFNYPGLS